MLLAYILIFTLLGSIASLIGGILLLAKRNLADKFSHLLISFAAGALLAISFFDLMPEAAKDSSVEHMLVFTLLGFLGFFILERFIHFLHNHPYEVTGERRTVPLILTGASLHKVMDGAAIAGTFLINIPLGIITAFAVVGHEIPREMGDFAVMLKRGLKPKKIFLFNFFSSLSAVVGAMLIYIFGRELSTILPSFVAITAGFFIYISASNLIPEIHEKNKTGFAFLESVFLISGVIVIWGLVNLLE